MLPAPAPSLGPAWRNPAPIKVYDLAIIGAGPAGLTAAREAAALGARVALIEPRPARSDVRFPPLAVIQQVRFLAAHWGATSTRGIVQVARG